MSEKTAEKHLKKITVLVALISVLILVSGGIITFSLNRVQQEGIDNRIKNGVESYKDDLLQRIKADFQTVYTLSAFLEFNETMDKESFSRGLLESSNRNSFIRMGYFNLNGSGVRVTSGEEIETDKHVEELNSHMQEIIEKAWSGEEAFSGIFYDEELEGDVIGYAVPVYRSGKIIGALASTEEASVLNEILSNDVVFGGNGFIQLINDQGKYLFPYEEESIFSGGYFSDREEKHLESILEHRESTFASVNYQGEKYQIYIAPVGIRDWSLFGVEAVDESNKFTNQMIMITRIASSLVLFAVILLIFYGYRFL